MGLEDYAARLIVEAGIVYRGEFTLASGRRSDVYVDLRRVLGIPRLFKTLASLLYALHGVVLEEAQAIAGVATGGIPWATALSLLSGKPLGYVRPRPKDHGLGRGVEGLTPPMRVVVVDDVATSGESILNAVRVLRSEGFEATDALVLVDRGEGAAERLKANGVRLHSLTSLGRIKGLLPG